MTRSKVKFFGYLFLIIVTIVAVVKYKSMRNASYEAVQYSNVGKIASHLMATVEPVEDTDGVDSLIYTKFIKFYDASEGSDFTFIDKRPFGLSEEDRLVVSLYSSVRFSVENTSERKREVYRSSYKVDTKFGFFYLEYNENVPDLPSSGGMGQEPVDYKLRLFAALLDGDDNEYQNKL